MEAFDCKNNDQIMLAIAIKTNQLKRDSLASLTYQHVKTTLFGYTWGLHTPKTMNEAIDDIFKLKINEIIAFLSNQAIIVGSQMEIEDFKDLIEQH